MKFSASLSRAVAILSISVAAALGFTSVADARPNVSGDLLTPGTLLVGSDIPYPPFEQGRKPHYGGFDIDLVNAVAKKLHLKVKIKDTAFDTIFTDVARRKFDLVASAATITPDRKRTVAFSDPYYDALQSIVVRRHSRIHSVSGLAGRVVGVQSGTVGEWFAKDETDAARVVDFPNGPAALRAVRRGRVDATILDQPIVGKLSRHRKGLRVARNVSVGQFYGFAMSKDTPKLRRGVNWALDRTKADGTFRRLYRKWFGINPPRSLRR
ncbi:MAG: amino acid ABC transporter substrate-binding protein [Solirubrobacterales bacterium]|nr:amino acid ABC transporter substrate-binding protein [Solirubrobacterales bacterium]